MILDKHNETHDLYVKALRSMNENNVVSEYRKVPDTKEETQFMKETNRETSKRGFMFTYPHNFYERIFRSNA